MRTLDINKQRLLYSLQSTEQTPVYVTDSDGNIKYYTDSEGNQIPLETGEHSYTYSEPTEFYVNMSMGGSDTQAEVFGIDMSAYDATLVYLKDEFPLTETSVIWYDSEPKYKDSNKAIPEEKSADYQVVKIVKSLNGTTAVLKKRVK